MEPDLPTNQLHIRDLTVRDPAGENLLHLPELIVKSGEAVWIDGPIGIGKSTLLKPFPASGRTVKDKFPCLLAKRFFFRKKPICL